MSKTDDIIEAYGKKCAAEREAEAKTLADVEGRCGDLNAFIARVSEGETRVTADGVAGGMQMLAGWYDPRHFMRLAAENLKAARRSASFLQSVGRAEAAFHAFTYMNRAAAFRRRAADLLAAQRVAA